MAHLSIGLNSFEDNWYVDNYHNEAWYDDTSWHKTKACMQQTLKAMQGVTHTSTVQLPYNWNVHTTPFGLVGASSSPTEPFSGTTPGVVTVNLAWVHPNTSAVTEEDLLTSFNNFVSSNSSFYSFGDVNWDDGVATIHTDSEENRSATLTFNTTWK